MNKKDKMNKIFFWFEENRFENTGNYSRDLNLVFEFADWIDKKEGESFICNYFDTDDVENIKGEFNRGINSYLDAVKKNNLGGQKK